MVLTETGVNAKRPMEISPGLSGNFRATGGRGLWPEVAACKFLFNQIDH